MAEREYTDLINGDSSLVCGDLPSGSYRAHSFRVGRFDQSNAQVVEAPCQQENSQTFAIDHRPRRACTSGLICALDSSLVRSFLAMIGTLVSSLVRAFDVTPRSSHCANTRSFSYCRLSGDWKSQCRRIHKSRSSAIWLCLPRCFRLFRLPLGAQIRGLTGQGALP